MPRHDLKLSAREIPKWKLKDSSDWIISLSTPLEKMLAADDPVAWLADLVKNAIDDLKAVSLIADIESKSV